MDVRLSPEQQALRDSAAQVVDRLGPQTVGQLDDGERTEKLDAAIAASGWRELRSRGGRRRHRSPPASRWRSSPRSSAAASPTRRSSARPWRQSSGASPAPRRPPRPETVALAPGLDGAGLRRPRRAAVGSRGDRRGAAPRVRSCSCRHLTVTCWPRSRCSPATSGVDLTRPTAVLEATAPAAVPDQAPAARRGRPGSLDRARPGDDLRRPGRHHAGRGAARL